jgi:hypothetical protein
MTRRFFLRSLAGISAASAATGLYAWQIEPFWLEFVELNMPVKNLPVALTGKTLMQISDLHVGKRFDHQFLGRSLEEAKKYKPDIVVYTGDFISLHKQKVMVDELQQVIQWMVKGSLGTYAILGNHDYGENWRQPFVADQMERMLAARGIQVLRNEQADCGGLGIIGFDDYWGTAFDPRKAMERYKPGQPAVLLCHNPDVCDLNHFNNYQGWILSGHTHGGQVRPPFLNPPILPVKNTRYTAGKIELEERKTLYINRALGHLWQVRMNVRPEITAFTLQNG